ncbi:MAG: hypothetical protein EA412_13570 [Chitinophagaceae bacterium]|nr:MAG: hypothetical protein EA412_13570 [Chitinophagaceae bacterium]
MLRFLLLSFGFLSIIIGSAQAQFCDQAQATPGFPSDLNCQTSVCNIDPFCCNSLWDGICASMAENDPNCTACLSTAGGCPAPAPYSPGDPCYDLIVTNDPFCCNTMWDAFCQADYDACSGGGGGCAATSPYSPGDNCYDLVIASDPYCCDIQWDAFCQAAYDDCGGCLNTIQFPGIAIAADPSGSPVMISGCSFQTEFSVITNIVAGNIYQFSATNGYITVREGAFNGPVVASGFTPVNYLANSNQNLYIHWTVDGNCNTATNCIETSVQCISCTSNELLIHQNLSDYDLAQSLVGNGVSISNVQITCNSNSYGSFQENTSNLGLPEGVLLTTGNIYEVANPSSLFMSTDMGSPGDATLNQLVSPQVTYDACVMQFDVTPLGDTLRFRYRFGSEEYPEFVCSQYNDVFGFFINGPNPQGGNYTDQNIAIVPGTNLPVAINSINSGTPGVFASGSCNNPGESLAFSSLYVNNISPASPTYNSIIFDGLTGILTAEIEVIPCQTYTLKLAIADVGDGVFDSGVFVEEISSPEVEMEVSTQAGIPYAVAGCNDGILNFSTNFISQDPIVTHFIVGGSALPGINYNPLPDSVVIQPGESSFQLDVEVLEDLQNLGGDSITISLIDPCTGLAFQTTTLFIVSEPEIDLPFSDTLLCAGESVQLIADGAYSYSWSPSTALNDDQISNPIATPSDSIVYTVTGSLGNCPEDSADVTVNVVPYTSGVWMGTINEDWHVDANWGCGGVPNPTTDVLIPGAPLNQPIIYSNNTGVCRSIWLESGARLEIESQAILNVNEP